MSVGPEFARVAVALTSWPPTDGVLAWTAESPAEAVEVLATRGLWPWPVGDDASPRWRCERCGSPIHIVTPQPAAVAFGRPIVGAGQVLTIPSDVRFDVIAVSAAPCVDCGGARSTADPPTLAALVAVASLGAPTLLRAEELARVLVGREPRLVWRVMPMEALARWSQVGDGRPVATAPQTIPQAACVARERWQSGDHWNGPSPWWLHDAPADVAAAWPAVRDLAAIGVTPVALDGDRITLAVEAL